MLESCRVGLATGEFYLLRGWSKSRVKSAAFLAYDVECSSGLLGCKEGDVVFGNECSRLRLVADLSTCFFFNPLLYKER